MTEPQRVANAQKQGAIGAECTEASSAHTACGILPSEEMILSGSTESVITVYISPSGKLCFKSWSRVQSAEFRMQSAELASPCRRGGGVADGEVS